MKKSLLLITALIVLAVLAGCNADQIAGFGKGMESLSDLGLGSRRKEPMNAAVENVKAYIETTESFMDYTPPSDGKDGFLNFKSNDAKKSYFEAVDKTIETLLAAKDSSAKSKALKEALNAKYEGLNTSTTYRNMFESLSHEPALLGQVVVNLADEDGRTNLVMMLASLAGIQVKDNTIETVGKVIETLKTTDLPLPVQSGEYTIILAMAFPRIQSIVGAVTTMSQASSSGSGKKLNMNALVQLQKDIAKAVGDRSYQTVADKMAFAFLYDILNTIIDIDMRFREDPEYFDPGTNSYNNFFDFVFANEKGLTSFDHILNCLDAIAYVYDVKLDIAGIVSDNI